MSSNIFSMIGLSGIDPAIIFMVMLIIIVIAFVLLVLQANRIKKLEKKYEKFMTGKDASSLEDEIAGLFHDNRIIRSENEKNRKDIIDINKRLTNSFQKIGLEKYDAFNQNGGKLSFAICMLDENDNGFLLNSVHNSDGMNYSYSKEINAGISDVELSSDEKRALEKAIASVNR
ncbi:DUF4446 family protein [Butyrivibrio sp. YAB3001]|uniref:DUF4446 family protein n=1 Tax=Butyrivibrio sp. YAB3001 TaxID=1520812 RepID=UPI0008F62BE7|nr:DUF4446 family protein [Butyrivibrio sp. YAB3001]SFC85363.1 Protein of unknown function [Butyrivibrio sp. YAB3001]